MRLTGSHHIAERAVTVQHDAMPYPRILIVDDHKEFREAARHFLELRHVRARMTEASSGEEGILIAQRIKPKVVIMDFFLRGMNGLEAARKIKEYNPKCSIIMLTMFDPKEIAGAAFNDVINVFISKGDLYDRLIPAIDKFL